jgi:hypothetical protein
MESGSLTLFAAYCFTGPSGTIDPRTYSGIISRSTSICCGQEGHASDRSSSDAPGLELPRLQQDFPFGNLAWSPIQYYSRNEQY